MFRLDIDAWGLRSMLKYSVDVVQAKSSCFLADTATLDVACSALFGFPLVIFRTFRAPYEVFTGHAVKRAKHWEAYNLLLDAPMDQDRYHDKDLIALFSVDSGNRGTVINLQGLRLSSEFVLRIIEVRQ